MSLFKIELFFNSSLSAFLFLQTFFKIKTRLNFFTPEVTLFPWVDFFDRGSAFLKIKALTLFSRVVSNFTKDQARFFRLVTFLINLNPLKSLRNKK